MNLALNLSTISLILMSLCCLQVERLAVISTVEASVPQFTKEHMSSKCAVALTFTLHLLYFRIVLLDPL